MTLDECIEKLQPDDIIRRDYYTNFLKLREIKPKRSSAHAFSIDHVKDILHAKKIVAEENEDTLFGIEAITRYTLADQLTKDDMQATDWEKV